MGLLSGGLKLVGGAIGSHMANHGLERAARAASFRPFNIHTGLGSAIFKGRDATGSLSPEYQAIRDKLLSLSGGFLNGFSGNTSFNPETESTDALRLLRNLAQPQENQAYLDLENRLFSQGRLGASGVDGNPELKAFFTARNTADTQRQLQAIGLGQSLFNTRLSGLNAGMGLLSGAQGLDKSVQDLLTMGLTGGKYGADAGANQAPYLAAKGQNQADLVNGLFSGLGDMFGGGGMGGGGAGGGFMSGIF